MQRQLEQRARLQEQVRSRAHPLNYDYFEAAIDSIVGIWGSDMVYAPGWTPLEWAIDLKQNITLEVWNDQEIAYHIQKKILRFLNDFRENLLKNPQVAPDIYMKDFPSFERLRWLGHHSLRGLSITRADSWMRKMTFKDFTKWRQTFTTEVQSARYDSDGLHDLFDECMKSLRTIKDSNLYTAWFNSIDKDIKLHWYVCVRHGKLPGVIGALKACREMLEKAKEVVDTVLRLCLPSSSELLILCGLVDTPNEQHNNDRFVPRKRHRDELPDDSQYRQSQSRPALPFPRQDFENSTVLQNGNSDHLTGQLAIHRRSNLGKHPQTHDVAETNRNPSSSARWQYVEPSDGLNELVKQILKLYASSFDISVMKEAEGRLKTLMNAARHAPGSQAIAVVRGYFERLVRGGTFQLPAAELLPISLLAVGRINAERDAIRYHFP